MQSCRNSRPGCPRFGFPSASFTAREARCHWRPRTMRPTGFPAPGSMSSRVQVTSSGWKRRALSSLHFGASLGSKVNSVEALADAPSLADRLLDSARVRTTIFCRSSMRAPWGFSVAAHGNPSFHFVSRGHCRLEVHGEGERLLGAGALVVLPRGPEHALRDKPGSPTLWLDEILADTPPDASGRLHHGGQGAPTELVCGGFVLDARA